MCGMEKKYWVLERRDLAGPAYVAVEGGGFRGWTTSTADALRFPDRSSAARYRWDRTYDDVVVPTEHEDV